MGSETRYRSRILDWRTWDSDGHVVYNPLSGDTHLLIGISVSALQELAKATCTADELMQLLVKAWRGDGPPPSMSQLNDLLAGLDELGLIEVAP